MRLILFAYLSVCLRFEGILLSRHRVHIELIIPVRLDKRILHGQPIVVDPFIVPRTFLVKQEHVFGLAISIDHFQVEAHVLAEEWLEIACGVPVVKARDWNEAVNGEILGFDAITGQHFHLEEASLRVQIHGEN